LAQRLQLKRLFNSRSMSRTRLTWWNTPDTWHPWKTSLETAQVVWAYAFASPILRAGATNQYRWKAPVHTTKKTTGATNLSLPNKFKTISPINKWHRTQDDVFERNTWEKPHYIARFSSRHPFRKTSADNSKKLMLKESILENTERRCKIMENVRLETTSGGIERLTMMTTTVHLVRSLQTRREPACKVTRFCEER
jgi:hypothetical protein